LITRALLRVIDRWLPADLARLGHWEQLYRGRALAGTLLLAITYALVLLPVVAWMQRDDALYIRVVGIIGPLAVILIATCLWMLRRGHSFVLIGNIFMGLGWIPLVYIFLITGGFPNSPMMLFLLIHPVQAFLTAGPRSALVWCLVSMVTVGVLTRVEAAAVVPQVSMGVLDTVVITTWFASALLLFACFWFYDLISRRLTESIIRERDQADFAAAHDPLTGLLNRAAFGKRVELALVRARQSERPLALLLIDLDGFKEVNDSFGHHVGDLLLSQLARRMRAVVRESDVVARLGGDEFAVLLEGMAEGEPLQRMVEKLLLMLAEPVDCEGSTAKVSASIGVALAPSDGSDPESLQRAADRAMYAAKASGRSTALYYGQLDIAGVAISG
jgi:diguanylate cyclase (GGDEF)-like protein